MSLLHSSSAMLLARVLLLLACCRVAADRGEKKQAAAKARERAVKDALMIAEELDEKNEALLNARSREEALLNVRDRLGEAERLQHIPKYSDSNAQQQQEDLLARLAASVSAQGNSKAVHDLRALVRDIQHVRAQEAEAQQAAAEEQPRPREAALLEEKPASMDMDPLLAAEMESKALREESARELERIRGGGSSFSASLGTSDMAMAATTGATRPRRRPINRLVQLRLVRERRAAAAAKRARQSALLRQSTLNSERFQEDEDSLGSEVSMSSGLADVTDPRVAAPATISEDAPTLPDIDIGNMEDLGAGAQLQLDRSSRERDQSGTGTSTETCVSTYECLTERFVADGCTQENPCFCEKQSKTCKTATKCTDHAGCGAGQACVKHLEFFMCQERVEDAYPQEDRDADHKALEKEIVNMKEQREKLSTAAILAFDKMKAYHQAISELTEPMAKMRYEAEEALPHFIKQIEAKEPDRLKMLQGMEVQEKPEEVMQAIQNSFDELAALGDLEKNGDGGGSGGSDEPGSEDADKK